MKTSAIICEFNPLHHGHAYILSEMRREANCVIAIMSGNFVQRAQAALLDQYTRAELAVRAGADLVVELPFPWCAASAEFFAGAGTAIAEMMRADTLSFGIGTPDPVLLHRAAEVFLDPAVDEEIRRRVCGDDASEGIAAIREKCLKEKLGAECADIMHTPNDILGIEYLKQIREKGYACTPKMIRRLTAAEHPQFLGATQLREKLRTEPVDSVLPHVPAFVYAAICRAFETGDYAEDDALSQLAFQALRMAFSPADTVIAEGEGGLLERLRNAARDAASPAEMLAAAATKKYTNARIRRVLLYYLLKITPEDLRYTPTVTTVLAASKVGCSYLSTLKKTSMLSFLTKPSDYRYLDNELRAMYEYTLHADSLYTLCQKNQKPADYYLKQTPFIEK